MKGTILVVDDDQSLCEFLEVGLRRAGFAVTCSTEADDALRRLDTGEVDAVLADLEMRGVGGLELCERVVASRPDVPVVLMTAFGSLEAAIGAIRAGAYDFLTKPIELDALVVALERAVQHRRLRAEVQQLRRVVALARTDVVGADDLPARVTSPRVTAASTEATPAGSFAPLDEVERRHILRVLEAMHGNKTLAAQVLGIDRKTLHRKLVSWAAAPSRASFRGVSSQLG